MKRQAAVIALAVCSLLAAGCSSSDDAAPTNSIASADSTGCPSGTTLTDRLCVASGAQAEQAARAVQKSFQDNSLGASVVGVWQDGKPLLVGALGESVAGVPATTDVHHRLGNVATAMLSTVLLQQVEAGKLALTDKLSKWYPELPSADEVTVEMLARNTTGYAHFAATEGFQRDYPLDTFRFWTPEELIAYGVAGGPSFPPGTSFLFSDTNPLILSEVLAKATGRPVDQLLKEGILDRLGMKNTVPPTSSFLPEPVLHSYGNDRGPWEEQTFWNPSWIGYAGGLGANQDDVRKFMDALGSGELVSKASHEAQLAPVNVGLGGHGFENTSTRYYGMGLVVANGWVFMNPNLQGLQAGVGHLPAKKLTIVVYDSPSPTSDPKIRPATVLAEELSSIFSPDQPIKFA
jgi:D-alanyl-D-alanine carboxypeptidase